LTYNLPVSRKPSQGKKQATQNIWERAEFCTIGQLDPGVIQSEEAGLHSFLPVKIKRHAKIK
jgi:hypothetical protein